MSHPARAASKAQGKRAGTSLLAPGVYAAEPPLFPPAPEGIAAASAPGLAASQNVPAAPSKRASSCCAPKSSLIPPLPTKVPPSSPADEPKAAPTLPCPPPLERRSSADSLASGTHAAHDDRPQFETICQIRGSLAEMEHAYSSQPGNTPLTGRIIHVSHYLPFVVRASAEVAYQEQRQTNANQHNAIADAQERRTAILGDAQSQLSQPELDASAGHKAIIRSEPNSDMGAALMNGLNSCASRKSAEGLPALALDQPTSSPSPLASTLPSSTSPSDKASSRWVLEPRRGHTALNSGVQSLCKTHKQTFVGWLGDIDFASGAQGDKRVESSELAPSEQEEIAQVLLELEDRSKWPTHILPDPADDQKRTGDATKFPERRDQVVYQSLAPAAREERREEEEDQTEEVSNGIKYVPVWLDSETAHGHYEGYCKTVLWPLLHYLLWEDVNPVKSGLTWDDSSWNAYAAANQAYAQRIADEYQPGDMVIVHDYHLLLVPKLLRQLIPEAHITLFMHAPFPSSEVFRCLPKREAILEGMLGADLACFQAFSYSRHFLSSCVRVCGFDASYNSVESTDGQVTSISYNPIGIDAMQISEDARSPSVRPKMEAFRRMYADKKIIVGRDKLDVVRGVLQKLQAFQKLLEEYPEWRGKVVLIQVTAPAVHESPALERQVSELVSQINSEYGTLSFAPVHHYHQIIDRDEYFALLGVADLALVTSVRDGMNTTSMEYVICQELYGKHSPLVLSEFTGTASRMRTALQVNPWNTWGVAKAINEALTLGSQDKTARHRLAYDQVTLHTSHTWAATLVRQLVYRLHIEETAHLTPELERNAVITDWKAAAQSDGRRLILLDYDGTLTPIVKRPEMAVPSARLLETLATLSKDPKNLIFIISGRDQTFLSKHLGHLDNLGFSAEHGCFLKEPGAHEWINIAKDFDMSWQQDIRAIFEYYTERTTGSHIEQKKSSITWHHRNADPDYGSFQAKECQAHLENLLDYNHLPIEVLVGKKNLEVRPLAVNKGEIVKRILAAHSDTEFVLCAGDDKTDEDMFRALTAVKVHEKGFRTPLEPLSPQSPIKAPHTSTFPVRDLAAAIRAAPAWNSSLQKERTKGGSDMEKPMAHPWEEAMAIGVPSGASSPMKRTDSHRPMALYTVTVGPATKKTMAHWHVDDPHDVIDVLAKFAATD